MRIRFGLNVEGSRAWQPANRLGEPLLGPNGFLNLLETQLGLLRLQPSHGERVVQYRACLQKHDSEARFYHSTFLADEFGSASTLLSWRDRWYLHGWDGSIPEAAGLRLRDMADVETSARLQVPPSMGERLAGVSETLKQRKTSIKEVLLLDPLEDFPKRWQQILEQLPSRPPPNPSPAAETGLLRKLQQALLDAQSGPSKEKLHWQDDGTILAVRSETRLLAARWLAESLRNQMGTRLLVAPNDGALLDEVLVASDLPRQGLREPSAFRPTLQLLPLAMKLVWEPLDIHALLQFLTHPVSPLPAFARWKLAGKIADTPGIGGAAWDRALADIDAHYGSDAPNVRQGIKFWVEHKRHDPGHGAPIDVLIKRARAVTEYFRIRLAEADPTARVAYTAGYSQSSSLLTSLGTLAQHGETLLRPRQLEQLLAQQTARGSENPLLVPEVGAGQIAVDPGAVIEPVDTVIWWQLGAPTLPDSYPWSRAEVAELRLAGVALPQIDDVLQRLARTWIRPLLAARKRLVLVLPPAGEEVHPQWQAIAALVDKLPIHSLDTALADEHAQASFGPIEHVPLPEMRRWWQLPKGVAIPERTRHSYTSLTLLLNNPYHWVLQYPAGLSPTRIIAASDDFRLYGNLAHRLVELFYSQPDAVTFPAAGVRAWFETTFPSVIATEGALLLMPGRRVHLEAFRRRLLHALSQLQMQLQAAGVREVSPERPVEGSYEGGAITGYADLVVTTQKGHPAIIDMKWSGRKYRDKLAAGQYLQLLIYAECLRQQQGRWPALAYYVLDRAQLITLDGEAFPNALIAPDRSGENPAQLWQRFRESWKWRHEQLLAGNIEVVLEELQETPESVPPSAGLEIEPLSPQYNDYLTLAGWGD